MLSKERMDKVIIDVVKTPVGEMLLGALDGKLCLCDWKENRHRARNDNRIKRILRAEYMNHTDCMCESEYVSVSDDSLHTSSNILLKARRELEEYFVGKRKSFDIPLLLAGTDFQKSVWQVLLEIPYGKTASYRDVAEEIGNLKGVRAVAQAIGANPIAIFVPCHRVIGSDGSLTGFAGGMNAKKILLEMEK